MQKTDFIKELATKANITEQQASQVNEILEADHFIGKISNETVISKIAEKLGIEPTASDEDKLERRSKCI